MSSKLNWESFAPLFGTWANRFKPFFDSGGFDPIYDKLKRDSLRGKRVAPLSSNVFRCFSETPIDNVKVVIVGMCPYHTFLNGYPIADGLLMGCSVTGRLQPSLTKFYEALEKDVGRGLSLTMVKNPDVSYLAEQGVLLLNAALTVEAGKPGSHNDIWEPFMKFLFEEVLLTTGIPVVLLGKEAQKIKRYIMPFTWIFELSHPASASYNNIDWDSQGVFTSVDKIIKETNNNSIQWIQTE